MIWKWDIRKLFRIWHLYVRQSDKTMRTTSVIFNLLLICVAFYIRYHIILKSKVSHLIGIFQKIFKTFEKITWLKSYVNLAKSFECSFQRIIHSWKTLTLIFLTWKYWIYENPILIGLYCTLPAEQSSWLHSIFEAYKVMPICL